MIEFVLEEGTTQDNIRNFLERYPNVVHVITNATSGVLSRIFYNVMPDFPSKTLVATGSTLPSIRADVPKNIWFGLSSDDFFLFEVFNTLYSSTASRWLVINTNGDPYLEYVKSFAESFGIQTTTVANMLSIQASLAAADVIYIDLFYLDQQLQAMANIPAGFNETLAFIDLQPINKQVFDACPQARTIIGYSPGTSISLYFTHPYVLATKQSFAKYIISSNLILFLLMTFVDQWDVLEQREMLFQKNVGLQYVFIYYR